MDKCEAVYGTKRCNNNAEIVIFSNYEMKNFKVCQKCAKIIKKQFQFDNNYGRKD